MAKKKATMTLKDFHGGSIPSDLSLPSAPGETVRPLNHVGFDRQSSWTNPMGRQDHRLRPGSAGAVRTYDDKTPFLAHNVQIGRNFDEDERKPLDGGSAPRRTVSDENIRGGTVVPVRQEPKSDYPLAGNVPARPATTPLSQFTGGSTGGSFAARFSEAANVSSGTSRSYVKSEVGSLGPSNSNVGVESKIRGPSPNAWGPRKVAVGISESVAASWSAPDAATKSSSMNDRLPMARTSTHSDGVQVQPSHGGVTLGGPESTERPKLKLLPRSKPVDSIEPLVAYKQTMPQSGELVTRSDTYGNVNSSVHNLAGLDDANQVSERPRVNLKPRLQSLEQIERNTERERNAVFGGARPRELVLKERGVDDVAVTQDMIQSPNRMKKDITRAENPPMNPTVTSRQNGKSEPFDHHRTGKTIDRREAEKSDAQRRSNWRNDNRKSSRDLEQQQERPPSPETWRKPVDPEPSAGPRYGKAASAVELAQAFSKSVSDPKVVAIDRFSSQRGLPGQAQIPFSRLTSQPATRSHINGH
ncbi:putative plant specific eukaryotic initiation factor 4B [Helianthus annuus]|nr:putative plant specific eukaryotic initiation factor 4B [Helianthus annuus]KAJ0473518.1 putative plant specific eukaryotic initiation factor 4B [Helianthus annuus]KAJ0649105.1 putative plant specific eukaryotic initiation factor 4B [Helianthus annuus]